MIPTPLPREQDSVVNWLTQRQYVRPHDPLGDVLATFRQATNTQVCVLRAAGFDPADPIGRLKRDQLESLAVRIVDAMRN